MINEKHARCVLPVIKKVHFAPPLFKKKTNNEERDGYDGVLEYEILLMERVGVGYTTAKGVIEGSDRR